MDTIEEKIKDTGIHENRAIQNLEKVMEELTKRNEDLEGKFDIMENFSINAMHLAATTLHLVHTSSMGE